MAELNDLSVTDASNTGRWPENMAPSAVNNAGRADEGMLARADKDNNGSLVTAGTSTAYTVTLNSQHAAWFNGLRFRARIDETCGATPTINPTGSVALGAKSIYRPDGAQVTTGGLVADGVYDFVYMSAADKVYVLSHSGFSGQYPFPATQNASSDANTLDDYEEGTWTPVVTFATPGDVAVTYTIQAAAYTKVGRFGSLHGNIVTASFSHTTAAGNLNVTGCPFTTISSPNVQSIGAVVWGGVTKASYTDVAACIGSNSALIFFSASGSGVASSNVAAADVPTGGLVVLRFTIPCQFQ